MTDTPEVDLLEEAVNRLTAQTGTLFVIAAGNEGPGESTVGSPGSADAALTVGAVDKQDKLADFSSRGPRVGDGAVKPDVTAPGVDIVAAKAKKSVIGDPVGEQYLRLSGTSMATPHTAGAAALLAQQHPSWKAGELKGALMGSAKPAADQTAFEQGTGRIDVAQGHRADRDHRAGQPVVRYRDLAAPRRHPGDQEADLPQPRRPAGDAQPDRDAGGSERGSRSGRCAPAQREQGHRPGRRDRVGAGHVEHEPQRPGRRLLRPGHRDRP